MLWQRVVAVLKRDVLLYVVFFTGAVVLAVEVMAVRILSPYFGNTIYSFSSVISVILAALSVGYWHGGRLADRMPDTKRFYRLVSAAGVSVIIVQLVSVIVLPITASLFSIVYGPLIATIVLFFIPSYLFGLLSPYVIKLRSVALPEYGVGQVSGEVFFASTLGSIVGSLLSGFVLIPQVGISTSMLTMGGSVVLVGVIGRSLVLGTHVKRSVLAASVVFLMCVGWIGTSSELGAFAAPGTVLFTTDGLYERITVVEQPVFGQLSRVLLLDRSYSSGVTVPDGQLIFPYTHYYKLYSFFHPTLERALVLGAGTGTIAKKLHEDYPEAIIDIVDVEPVLFRLAHEYFYLPHDEQIREHLTDGRQYLSRVDVEYDLIFGDMYSSLYSIPWHVSTKEYYELLYRRLSDEGVYVGNYIASLDETPPSLFGSTIRTIHEVFDTVHVFGTDSTNSKEVQNIMVVAVKGDTAPMLSAATLWHSEDIRLKQFAPHLIEYNPGALYMHDMFTDERAPIELYTASLIRRASL